MTKRTRVPDVVDLDQVEADKAAATRIKRDLAKLGVTIPPVEYLAADPADGELGPDYGLEFRTAPVTTCLVDHFVTTKTGRLKTKSCGKNAFYHLKFGTGSQYPICKECFVEKSKKGLFQITISEMPHNKL
jgi:hypothetical protein